MEFVAFLVVFIALSSSTRGAEGIGAPRIQPFTFPTNLKVGESVKVICTAVEGSQPLTFQWFKNGKRLPSSAHVSVKSYEDFSVLAIDDLVLDSNGNYTCSLNNQEGSDQFTAPLGVYGPPEWIVEPRDVTVTFGDTVTFHCLVKGVPKPLIYWKFKSDSSTEEFRKVTSGGHYSQLLNGSLSISDVGQEDAGSYKCETSNGIGTELISKVVSLNLIVPVTFEQKFAVERVRHEETANLMCNAHGDNPMTFTWLKDKVILSTTENVRYQIYDRTREHGTQSEIQIYAVNRNDNGLYTCEAENASGKDKRNIKLLVLEVPDSPSDIRIEEVWSRSVSLSWTVPYSGNSPILKYIIHYWRDQDGAPLRLEEQPISSTETSSLLKDLHPGSFYNVKVMAVNEVGQGNPSDSRSFITQEEEPGAPPTDVHVETKGTETLLITWKAPPRNSWNGHLVGYYIGYKVKNSSAPFSLRTVNMSKHQEQEYFLRHLKRNTEYAITVSAFNSAGSGQQSQVVFRKTADADLPPPPNVFLVSRSTNSVGLKWTQESEDISITHYTLYYSEDEGPWKEVTIPVFDDNFFELQGLKQGTFYQMYLQASSEKGNSDPSERILIRTKAVSNWKSQVVLNGDENRSSHPNWSVVIPVTSGVVIIVIVISISCYYVKREQMKHREALKVAADNTYPYSIGGPVPYMTIQRHASVEKTQQLHPSPPRPPPLSLLPSIYSDDYPAPYATLPLHYSGSNRWRSIQNGGSVPDQISKHCEQKNENTLEQTAEVHHYDIAA